MQVLKSGCLLLWKIYRETEMQKSPLNKNPINKAKWIKIAIILVYIFSPIDVLPEVILGPLGLVDDAAAVWLLVKTLLEK